MPICQKRHNVNLSISTASPVKRRKVVAEESRNGEIQSSAQAVPKETTIATTRVAKSSVDTVLINLDRRADRLAACAKHLASYCPELRWKRLPACEGRKEVIELSEVTTAWHSRRNVEYQKIRATRKGWNDHDSYVARTIFMSAGERGCAKSHIVAWRMCAERTDGKPLLVLEDDAEPSQDFSKIFAQCMETLPGDADILYLGYSQAAPWRRQVSPVLVEAEYVWTTVAYLIWPRCAAYFLEQLPINQPVDNWMACMCADNKIKSYCVAPKIVRQAGEWNKDSDIRHSDEHYWGEDSNIVHSDSVVATSEQSSATMSTEPDLGAETSDEDDEDGWD
jgi:GR25 family glycosyltransferase involved in LPS biosynthesis